jgi:hypothetical protein
MASLNDINALLRSIEDNTALLVEDEKRIINAIAVIQQKPDTTKKPELKSYQLQKTDGSEMQKLLSEIEQLVNYLIQRNQVWRTYRENLLGDPIISIKQYITGCDIQSITNCYENIDEQLQFRLLLPSKQQEQVTIFQKGYLLYDLVRENEIDQFRYLLTSDSITYNEVRHEPRLQLQVGGKALKLLQVIGLTKIKAILKYMYGKYKEAKKYNFRITKGTTTTELENYLSTKSDVFEDVNIIYELADKQESVQQTEKLTKEQCIRRYKNGNIINIIASFFYEEAIIKGQ